MSREPIDMMLDGVTWVERTEPTPEDDSIPYATHEGVLDLTGFASLRVYRLSNGMAVINADDLEAFFGSGE